MESRGIDWVKRIYSVASQSSLESRDSGPAAVSGDTAVDITGAFHRHLREEAVVRWTMHVRAQDTKAIGHVPVAADCSLCSRTTALSPDCMPLSC